MSFQPPPPAGPPPQQPPAWGGPPPAGPPAFGSPGPQPGAPGGRAHKPKMVAPAMIVAALVLIAVAVGVVLVTRGGGGGVDGEAAADGFAAVVDDADYSDGFAELRRCPFGDVADLNGQVAGTLDLSDDLTDDLDDENTYQYVSDADGALPESVFCFAGADINDSAADNIIYTASELPDDDYDRFLEDTFPYGRVDVGDPEGFEGGTIYPYCFEPDDESTGGPAGCGADWVDEDADLAIGLNYSTNDDFGPAVEALKDVLPDLVDALADQA